MSKIKVKSILKSNDGKYIFEGKGIKKDNKIIYNDNGVMTTITLGDEVYLERKKDYLLKMGFCTYNSLKGTYIIPEGNLEVKTVTKELKQSEGELKIVYSMEINNELIRDFELNLYYSIDS